MAPLLPSERTSGVLYAAEHALLYTRHALHARALPARCAVPTPDWSQQRCWSAAHQRSAGRGRRAPGASRWDQGQARRRHAPRTASAPAWRAPSVGVRLAS